RKRFGRYLIDNLRNILGNPVASTDYSFQPTVDAIKKLKSFDPDRINIDKWNEIEDQVELHKDKVFISCGQQNEHEIELGQEIVRAIKQETGLEGYFAENQQSLEGVTRNIFNAIYNSEAFIAVMHRRDILNNKPVEYRGSVWVEQEIAIAAFLVQVLGINIPNLVFIQSGIKREGVRGFVLLNAIEFKNNQEVLNKVRKWLPTLIDEQGK
ncbi:unnamed protein product, partial [marine sediment metagenome]